MLFSFYAFRRTSDRDDRRSDPIFSTKSQTWVIAQSLGLVLLTMWALVAVALITTYRSAVDDARDDTRNLSVAFRDQVGFYIRGIDRGTKILAERVQSEGVGFDLHRWMAENAFIIRKITDVSLLGPDGRLLSTILSSLPLDIDLSSREYFRVHLDDASPRMYIGEPTAAPVTGRTVIPITRRVAANDGTLIGVLLVFVHPKALTDLHTDASIGFNGVLVLSRLDDTLLARYAADSPEGTETHGATFRLSLPSHATDGTFIGAGNDGITRAYAYWRIGDYPLIATVGFELSARLVEWRSLCWVVLGLAIAATVMLAALGIYLIRENRVRVRHERELAAERNSLAAINVELAETTQRAEAANRAKSLFLANMSHELRTPLNAIIGYSEMIRAELLGVGAGARERYREYAGDIAASGEHLLRIIVDVLDIANFEAGKLELSDDTCILREIVDASVKQVELALGQKGIGLNIDIPDILPPLRGDRQRLTQVLTNLLSNAAKFTVDGGTIGIAAQIDQAGALCCTVSDTGVGMSPDETALALEPFSQVDKREGHRTRGHGARLAAG